MSYNPPGTASGSIRFRSLVPKRMDEVYDPLLIENFEFIEAAPSGEGKERAHGRAWNCDELGGIRDGGIPGLFDGGRDVVREPGAFLRLVSGSALPGWGVRILWLVGSPRLM